MNSNMQKWLFIIFILLFIAVAYPYIINKLPYISHKSEKNNLVNLTKDQISSIILSNGKDEIVLEKKESTWKVNNKYPADTEKIVELLGYLVSDQKVSVVSKKQENHKEFGITDTSVKVTINKGKENTTVLAIGNGAEAGNSYYLKEKDSDVVYLISGSLKTILSLTETSWIDLYLINSETQAISKVEIIYKNNKYEFIKPNDTWKAKKNEKDISIEEDVIKTVISSLSHLKGYDIASEKDEALFNSSSEKLQINIFTSKDSPLFSPTVSLVSTKKDTYIGRRDDSYPVLYIYSSQLKELLDLVK